MTKFSNTTSVRLNVAAALAAVVISVSSLVTVVCATNVPLQTAAQNAPSAVTLPLA